MNSRGDLRRDARLSNSCFGRRRVGGLGRVAEPSGSGAVAAAAARRSHVAELMVGEDAFDEALSEKVDELVAITGVKNGASKGRSARRQGFALSRAKA